MNGFEQSALWNNRVEEADQESDQGIVGSVEGNVSRDVVEVCVKVLRELRDGKLSGMLWVKVLQDNVDGSVGDAEKVASQGVLVGNDGSAFLPFPPFVLLFEVYNATGDGEILAESPLIACAEAGGHCRSKVLGDVEWVERAPVSARFWGRRESIAEDKRFGATALSPRYSWSWRAGLAVKQGCCLR